MRRTGGGPILPVRWAKTIQDAASELRRIPVPRTWVNNVGCRQRWEVCKPGTREKYELLGVRGKGDRRQGDEGLGHSRRRAVALHVPPGHGLALAQIPHLPRPYGVGSGVGSLRPPEVAQ